MGSTFASHAGPVVEILMIGAWINGMAFIPFSLLQAQGRPDLVAKIHALEVVPFIIILWFLLKLFGLPGAALAWVLRASIDALLLFAAARFKFQHLVQVTPALALVLAAYVVAQFAASSLLWALLLATGMALASAAAAVVFDPNARKLLLLVRGRLIPVGN